MDRTRTLLLQLRSFLEEMPPARRASFLVLSIAAVAGTLALAWWAQNPSYGVLFANIDATDAGGVVEYLKAEKIPYRVGDNGTAIEVPRGRVYEARMLLAARGLPQGGGIGFEIFDRQTLGMTDFVQHLSYQRALQGELARTVASLSAVDAARVHLALPERSLFVTEDRRPSASVVVKLKAGRQLSPEQVAGVVHLVAASVEGMKASDVTIVDTSGAVLESGRKETGAHGAAGPMRAYQKEIEQGYVERIESMLERVLGPGHAVARVTAELDLAQVEKTEEVFDPDRTAVRTERRNAEKNLAAAASGVPGASATLTNETAAAAGPDGPRSEREDSVRNYEISRVTSRRVEPMGAIRKLTVAVLVDGVSRGEGAERTFVPRPAEEVERYKELVKRAVGFRKDRGDEIEIVSAPFQAAATEPLESPGVLARLSGWSDDLWRAAALLTLLVVALTVVRPWLLSVAGRPPLAPPKALAALERAALPAPPDLGAQLAEIARQNPQQAALVIRQWVAEESEA